MTDRTKIVISIPINKLDNYRAWVIEMRKHCNLKSDSHFNAAWDDSLFPIINVNRSFFSRNLWSSIANFLQSIGAVDITENHEKEN